MKKRICVLAVSLLMLLSLTVTARATHPVPDLSRNGSLTFRMASGDAVLDTGFLNIYKVGDLTEDDGNYFFTLLDGEKITTDDQINLILAEEMLTLAKEEKMTARVAKIEKGSAVFHDLKHGLYVVWQAKADACEGYAPIIPFLISVPRFIDGEYILDVVADPKVPFETAPTEPPTQPPSPPPPELPNTGQLNWPVPVLAVSGAALVILGIVLAGRKRGENA